MPIRSAASGLHPSFPASPRFGYPQLRWRALAAHMVRRRRGRPTGSHSAGGNRDRPCRCVGRTILLQRRRGRRSRDEGVGVAAGERPGSWAQRRWRFRVGPPDSRILAKKSRITSAAAQSGNRRATVRLHRPSPRVRPGLGGRPSGVRLAAGAPSRVRYNVMTRFLLSRNVAVQPVCRL